MSRAVSCQAPLSPRFTNPLERATRESPRATGVSLFERPRRRALQGCRWPSRVPFGNAQRPDCHSRRDDRGARQTAAWQTVTEVVQVTAESIPLFTASKAGTSDNVGTEVIETLPTINRSIQDFARVSPHFVQYAFNGDPSALSVAGRNTRYNNLQMTARSTTTCSASRPPQVRREARPKHSRSASTPSRNCSSSSRRTTSAREVSRAAASTRSRAAEPTRFAGPAFYVFRDQSLVGDGIDDRPIATFNDKQFGGTLGGPIVQEQGVLPRQPRMGPQRARRRDFRSAARRVSASAIRRKRSASSTSCSDATATTRASSDEFIRGDRQQQGVRARRLQPRQQPADGSSQLRRRLQRRRHAEQHHLQVPRQLLSLAQPDEFDRRPVELAASERSSTSSASPISASATSARRRRAFHKSQCDFRTAAASIAGTEQFSHRERTGSGHLRAAPTI